MSNPSRILFIAQLPPPVHGQAAVSKIIVNSPLIREALTASVLPLQFARTMEDIGAMSFGKIVKMVQVAFKINAAIRGFKPDIIYFSLSPKGLSFFRDVLYVSIMKQYNSKIVYHLHVKGIQQEGKSSRIKRILYKWVFKNTYVITLSHTIAGDLDDVYKGEPFVVNNGIIPAPIRQTRLSRSVPTGKPVLLYLSNLARAKGIFVFLDALALLKKNHVDFFARIVGMPSDVPTEEIWRYVNENKLADSVVVEGPKYDDEKYEVLQTADIFVHPTLNDAFPLVILEAMQFSLPIISTIEGSIPEIVDDGITGMLVPKNDAEELMKKIAWLLSNPDTRADMGKAGRAKFLARYTSDRMEQGIADVLLKIADVNPTTN